MVDPDRYGGFCEVVIAWRELGFLSDEPVEYLNRDASPMTWLELTAKAAASEPNEQCAPPYLATSSANLHQGNSRQTEEHAVFSRRSVQDTHLEVPSARSLLQ